MDKAQTSNEDLQAIWGTRTCAITNLRPPHHLIDIAHILGRGEIFGIKPNYPERIAFSSVFAVMPLLREIHNSGYRDTREFRYLQLDIVFRKVMDKVNIGRYTLKEKDRQFLALAHKWCEDHKIGNPIPDIYSTPH